METTTAPRIPDHELLSPIGHGSYGEVWLGRNLATGAYRAIKVVKRSTFEHDKPYQRELAGLRKFEPVSRSHDGLMDVLHVGENAGEGVFYAVMELADDASEGRRKNAECRMKTVGENSIQPERYAPRTLRREIQARGRLPAEEVLRHGILLASALGHLHEQGLVHRDIKPSNIIFVGGVPKLADIGLVTDRDTTGSFVGTEGYVPPEGPGTAAADVYALGKVLYEICTGRDRLDYPELPTALKDFPDRGAVAQMNEVFLRACEPVRRDRYQSARELGDDLQRLQKGQPLTRRRRPRLRRAWVLAVLGVAAAAMLLLPRGPTLRVVREVDVPDSMRRGRVVSGDWNGDDVTELFTTTTNGIGIWSPRGGRLDEWRLPASHPTDVGLDLATSAEGTGQPVPIATWRESGTNFLAALKCNHLGKPELNFMLSRKAEEATLGTNGLTRTYLHARKLVDLDQNGRRQLLAVLTSGYGHLSRGVCCFSLETNAERWCYRTGPSIEDVACLRPDGTNRLEIICGSSAPGNGNRGPDGLDDYHSCIFALSADGKPLWKQEMGGQYSQAHPLVVTTNHQGAQCLFAFVTYSGGDLLRAEGKTPAGLVTRFGEGGEVTGTTNLGSQIFSGAVRDLDLDGQQELIFTTRAGDVCALSPDLKLKYKHQFGSKAKPDWRVELLGIGDLNADELPELICACYDYKAASPLNPGFLTRPQTVYTTSVYTVSVLEQPSRASGGLHYQRDLDELLGARRDSFRCRPRSPQWLSIACGQARDHGTPPAPVSELLIKHIRA